MIVPTSQPSGAYVFAHSVAPGLADRLGQQVIVASSQEEFDAYIRAQTEKSTKVVKIAGNKLGDPLSGRNRSNARSVLSIAEHAGLDSAFQVLR